jgi:hypothetical protein
MKRSKLLIVMSLAMILSILAISIPATSVMAAGLTIDPDSGPPGTTITLRGSGYSSTDTYSVRRSKEPDEPGHTSDADTATVTSGSFNGEGEFSRTYLMPSLPRGEYFFFLKVGGVIVDTDSFTVMPKVTIGSSIGKVGDTISIGGKGFRESTTISIYFNNNVIKQPNTDSNGTFSTSFTVPEAAQGEQAIKCKDSMGYADEDTFTINPKLTVDQSNTSVGSQVTVSGTGFTGSSAISLAIDGNDVNAVASANIKGTFSDIKVTIPVLQGGSHTLKATDVEGYYDSVSISTSQSITVNPNSGATKTTVTVSGNGFAANKNIAITFKGTPVTTSPTTVTSDANGNFTATITVPEYASGAYEISVSDGTSNGKATFTISTLAKLGQTSGAIGSSVPVSGNGFKAGSAVTIKYDTAGIATVTADSSGAFSTNFKVPPSLAGAHKINITDGVNSVDLTFTATAVAQIGDGTTSGSQLTGAVGSAVTVSGSAFSPGATVTVKYDDSPAATGTVNAEGSFSVNFKAPAGKAGNHTVTASDGTNNLTFTFIMESTPPPVPALVSPTKDAQADSLPNFQWSGVTDPSGVTYNLQVAMDAGFNSVVVEKTLTATNYQLTETEKLSAAGQERPYYWRVRAIDGASNAGSWSTTQTFIVGAGGASATGTPGSSAIPPWALYFIYAVVIIVVFAAGFLVGRRNRRI